VKTLTVSLKKPGLKESALAVKAQLDACAVGYGDDKRFTSLVSPNPFLISSSDRNILVSRGQVIREWISTTNRLYRQSLTDPSMNWLRDLLETGLSEELIPIHRRLVQEHPMRVPLFVRMDQPSFGKAAEAQTPGSGWGYHAALATCYDDHAIIGRKFVAGVADNLRRLTGKQCPRVVHLLHKGDFYGSEAAYFAKSIQTEGIDFTISERLIPDDVASYDVVFRHYLEELTQYDGWQELLELYRHGVVEIEPPPSVLTDHKISMMMPFHPATFAYYSDAVRALFPTTYLVDPYAVYNIFLDGRVQALRLNDLQSIPGKRRQLVLKYAGMDPRKRAGGRGVFNLSFCSRRKTTEMLQQALDDTYRGEPWLLQEMNQQKYHVTFLNAEGEITQQHLYARINPFYAFPVEGASELLGCPAHFRNFWKVHGQPDAVETILAAS